MNPVLREVHDSKRHFSVVCLSGWGESTLTNPGSIPAFSYFVKIASLLEKVINSSVEQIQASM